MPYLLDTNVVTQLLKRTPPVVEKYQRVLQQGEQFYLSAVVYYEVKRGLLHRGATKQLAVRRGLQECTPLGTGIGRDMGSSLLFVGRMSSAGKTP